MKLLERDVAKLLDNLVEGQGIADMLGQKKSKFARDASPALSIASSIGSRKSLDLQTEWGVKKTSKKVLQFLRSKSIITEIISH